jgi:PhnB protein
MLKITAYITFKDNKCSQAMTFYQNVLGGELSLMPVKDSPMKDMFPAAAQEGILHASLIGDTFNILATDMPDANVEAVIGPVSLTLTCANKAEVQEKFNKLADGGKVIHPIMAFFAGSMGNVVDQFGVRWGVFTDEQ